MSSSKKKDLAAAIHQTRSAAHVTFKEKRDRMRENSAFLRLEQYSSSQLSKMSKQKRVPYTLDYINSAINTYQGIQRDQRTEIFYYGQGPEDEVKVEVLNSVKDATLAQNNFIYLESDVFTDGLVQATGAIGYEWTREKNKNGGLSLFRIPPRELSWDLNSTDFSKDNATWVSRMRLYSRGQLISRHPDKKKLIEKMDIWNDGLDNLTDLGLNESYLDSLGNSEYGWVGLIEHWSKKYERRWFILEKTKGYIQETYWDTQKDADEAVREKLSKWEGIKSQLSLTGKPVPPPPEFEVFEDTTHVIQKVELAADEVFSEEILDEPFYPVSFYHPYYHDSDWWCPVDVMKDGQRFFNKMFTMADHWIGTMSKGLLLIDENVPEDVAKKVIDGFSSTGGAMRVPDPEGNFNLLESKGPAPQLFTMLDLARQNLEDNAGGRNFAGKKESASESGVAVRTRVQQGALSNFVMYDNLRRTKIDVGEKIAWYLTNLMTLPQVVRIQGEALVQETMKTMQSSDWFTQNKLRPGVGYLKVNTAEQNTLEGIKVDVIVDEARWSVSKNQSTLQEINLSLQSNPLMAQVFPPEVMLEYMNLSFSVKEEARKSIQQRLQIQQQLEAAKAIKPPTMSASLSDIELLPPEAAAQLAAKFQIQLNPEDMEEGERKSAVEAGKRIMEMRLKKEEHDQKMAQARESHSLEMARKNAKTLHDMKVKENGQVAKAQEGSEA